jgi:predicted  nucleic acid-binding Zn-ribbon protein
MATTLLGSVILLGKVDGALARVLAERKKLEKELEVKRAALQKAEQETLTRQNALKEKQVRYQREENEIRDEQEKLTQRRKALASLNNYKVQQSAEREIEAASRQLQLREETILNFLQEVDDYQKIAERVAADRDKAKAELAALEADSVAAFAVLAERQAGYEAERKGITPLIDAGSLKTYDRLRNRYPMDVVVEVKNSACIGCQMNVGPQVTVQLLKGDKLVQCPGCNRLLHLVSDPVASAPH